MNLKQKISAMTALAAGALVASPVFAGEAVNSTDAFYSFYDTVGTWTGGALGTGLAITMLLMGGAMGVAKNSPMPALSGVAGAAFLHWGPVIIKQIMSSGGVF
jgi:conjugal transfer pilus assembly protein TraA